MVFFKLKHKKNFNLVDITGFIGSIMPLWNIPLIIKIVRNQSSNEISLLWLFGVWVSILCLLPQSLKSLNLHLKVSGILNVIFFSIVAFTVLYYKV